MFPQKFIFHLFLPRFIYTSVVAIILIRKSVNKFTEVEFLFCISDVRMTCNIFLIVSFILCSF